VDHINNDEVRRALREMGTTSELDHRALRTTLRAVLDSDAPADQRRAALVGRRRFLQLGGFTVATASVIAACGGADSAGVARVGLAPERTDLPAAQVNDVVLLRTASSIEHSAIAVYDMVIGTDLLAAGLQDAAKRFRDDHTAHAEIFEQLTVEAGGEAWTCGNPRIDELLVGQVVRQIMGDESAGLEPSDDPQRDVANFAHALETFAGSTYQAIVPALSLPSLRRESMLIGSTEVRHAAILAMAITGTPEGYVPPNEASAETPPIPVVYAIPSQFGQLSAQQVVLGAEDEVGVRRSFLVDTPSLNTYVYEYMTPEC
jgi:hypothetical protein